MEEKEEFGPYRSKSETSKACTYMSYTYEAEELASCICGLLNNASSTAQII
jgi:hypothetical protein